MEKCLYNGEEILASEIAKDYGIEEEIRKAGQDKRLMCIDKDCCQPVLYCRGAIRLPYFRHYDLSLQCAYNSFSKKKNASFEFICARKEIYDALVKNYASVKLEEKIFPTHWCDIILNIDNSVLPIELVNNYMTPRKYRSLQNTYQQAEGLEPLYIVICDRAFTEDELKTNAVERSQLYENYNTLIRYNSKEKIISIIYRIKHGEAYILYEKNYPLHLFRPDKLKEIKESIKQENQTRPIVAAKKLEEVPPEIRDFFIKHKEKYPLTRTTCSKFFYMYFSNSGADISKRIFASNVLRAGWNCDEESKNCLKGYVQYQKENKPDFYLKISHQFLEFCNVVDD